MRLLVLSKGVPLISKHLFVLAILGLLQPACGFWVAYRVDSEPSGQTIHNLEGEPLGTTPVVVVEKGLSKEYFNEETSCVQGLRTFKFPQATGDMLKSGSIRIPRTCKGQESQAAARAKQDLGFTIDLLPKPEPEARAQPQRALPVQVVVQAPEESVWRTQLATSTPVEMESRSKRKGRIMMIAGSSALVGIWGLTAALDYAENGKLGPASIPIFGPVMVGFEIFDAIGQSSCSGSGGLFCLLVGSAGIVMLVNAAAQAAGFGLTVTGISHYYKDSPKDAAEPAPAFYISPMQFPDEGFGTVFGLQF